MAKAEELAADLADRPHLRVRHGEEAVPHGERTELRGLPGLRGVRAAAARPDRGPPRRCRRVQGKAQAELRGTVTGRFEMARNDIVDVLIIGSGASGAAVAWSLAETKMRILCLEQGDWMKPTDFPSQRPRLGGAALQRLRHQPEPPRRATDRLSDQRRQLAHEGRQLQRRRRRHDHLHGALPAHASVRLPGAARWTASPTTGRSITGRSSRSTTRTTG